MTTTGRPPKAFISHASDDKERFVLEFASRLLSKGVVVWLDQWEMGGGDSLPDRIFERGIGTSDAVISVLSHVAMSKPWVKAEFDVSAVRHIDGKTRLIPIALDEDVEIPVAIQHVFRYDVPKQGIDRVVEEVVRDMFNVSRRPPLGNPPPYVSSPPNLRQLEDPIDTLVFATLIAQFRKQDTPNWITFSDVLNDELSPRGISPDQALESVEMLESQGLLNADPMAGRQRWQLRGIPDHVWLEEEARSGLDLDKLRRQMLSDVVNSSDSRRPIDWYDYHGVHWRTISAIMREFEHAGYLSIRFNNRGPWVHNVTPLAKRALRSME